MSENKTPVPVLSTGEPSTLGNWYKLCLIFFGEDSKGTKFIKDKLDKQGADEPVLSPEGQLLMAIHSMDLVGRTEQELLKELNRSPRITNGSPKTTNR